MLSVINKHFRHSVIMLNVVRLRIMALSVSLILQWENFYLFKRHKMIKHIQNQ
jgi:hypothetical protein